MIRMREVGKAEFEIIGEWFVVVRNDGTLVALTRNIEVATGLAERYVAVIKVFQPVESLSPLAVMDSNHTEGNA